MIVYDLRCDGGHVFEAWFGSSSAYDEQRTRGLVACPICGATTVEKALMTPNVAAKGNRGAGADPVRAKAALQALASAQAAALEKSQWVGRSFATRARAMHDGAEPSTLIHGQATLEEAKALVEEGVPVAPLPMPVVPPEASN